jgi:hypothetical protein
LLAACIAALTGDVERTPARAPSNAALLTVVWPMPIMVSWAIAITKAIMNGSSTMNVIVLVNPRLSRISFLSPDNCLLPPFEKSY